MRKSPYVLNIDVSFFKYFQSQLGESKDLEPRDMEHQLHFYSVTFFQGCT
jgi:hypothetical protein